MVSLFILCLLTFGLVNVVLYQQSYQEVYRLMAMGSAIAGLIWGLAIAHWSIQLLSLGLLWCGMTCSLETS